MAAFDQANPSNYAILRRYLVPTLLFDIRSFAA